MTLFPLCSCDIHAMDDDHYITYGDRDEQDCQVRNRVQSFGTLLPSRGLGLLQPVCLWACRHVPVIQIKPSTDCKAVGTTQVFMNSCLEGEVMEMRYVLHFVKWCRWPCIPWHRPTYLHSASRGVRGNPNKAFTSTGWHACRRTLVLCCYMTQQALRGRAAQGQRGLWTWTWPPWDRA